MKVGNLVWLDGKIEKYNEAHVLLAAQGLNYGFGAFEGIRARSVEEEAIIFRLTDHIKRFYQSAENLCYPLAKKFTPQQIEEACQDIVSKNRLGDAYIRPLLFFGSDSSGLTISGDNMHVAVIAYTLSPPFDKEIKVCLGEKRKDRRNLLVDAKASGQYQLFVHERERARQKGFDDVLFLDNDGNIAEAGASNIFLVKAQTLCTPPLENILPGVTRNSVINFARDLGYTVVEEHIPYSEIQNFSEAFLTGTALGIVAIKQINGWELSSMGVSQKLKEYYHDIARGKISKYETWLTRVRLA